MSHGELADRGDELDEVELDRFRTYRDNPTNELRNEIVVSYASLANAPVSYTHLTLPTNREV